MFHIGRSGRFHNACHLTFKGLNRIDQCHDWSQNTFIRERDFATGKFCNPYLADCSGNQLMNSDELKTALETGIGRLEFDGNYDTTYTTYTDELTEDELYAMSKERGYAYVDEILETYGYSDVGFSN